MHMCKKCFLTLIGIIFAAKFIFLVAYWAMDGMLTATINYWTVPSWWIYIAVFIDLILALWAFKIAMHIGKHECKDWNMKKKKK